MATKKTPQPVVRHTQVWESKAQLRAVRTFAKVEAIKEGISPKRALAWFVRRVVLDYINGRQS